MKRTGLVISPVEGLTYEDNTLEEAMVNASARLVLLAFF
jgi:hypothetical protein